MRMGGAWDLVREKGRIMMLNRFTNEDMLEEEVVKVDRAQVGSS